MSLSPDAAAGPLDAGESRLGCSVSADTQNEKWACEKLYGRMHTDIDSCLL